MDPATIALIVQFALQYGVPAAEKLIELFHKPAPTLEDWRAVFAAAKKSYASYEGALPPNVLPLPDNAA